MGKGRKDVVATRARGKLLEAGIGLVGVGALMLVIPVVLQASPILRALGTGLRLPALLALGVGVVLLVLHQWLRRPSQPKAAARREPEWAKPSSGRSAQAPPSANGEAFTQPQPKARTTWSAQVFQDIEWRRFEAVCEALFGQAGFETRTQSHGADGGVDIWLHSRHSLGPAAVVQCKHWLGKPVGVKEMREFYGVMASHKLQRGTYATSSTFTADALRFAKHNGISALVGAGLLALIARRTPDQQQALLATAYEGEYWKPTCASCGVKMIDREKKKGGNNFWGCPRFPRCRATLPMRAVVRAA